MNATHIVTHSRENASELPVTTAVYSIIVVMNEDDPIATDEQHREAFAAELQRALDAGFFTNLRYDAMTFDVPARVVIDVAAAGAKS